jgi:HAD superfamily hydrolase (TIGR01490 family)
VKSLALFDLDGTLYDGDSMQDFIRFVVGDRRFYVGFLLQSPTLIGLKVLKVVSRKRAKSRFLNHYFKAIPRGRLVSLARAFALQGIENRLRPSLAERLRWHQQQGHRCIIISASLDLWVAPIAAQLGLESISSIAHYEQDRIVGLEGENCHGPEKVRRLLQYLDGERYDMTYAYGDSSGDRELIAWADQGFWANKPLPPLE